MAGDITARFGTHSQTATITLASLGSGSQQEMTSVDNTSDKFTDALVRVKVKTASTGVSSTGYIAVYAYGSVTNGSDYGGGATGSNASISSVDGLIHIGSFPANANGTAFISQPFSVAAAFNNNLPAKWGIVVRNVTGAALSSTSGDHDVKWQGVGGGSYT